MKKQILIILSLGILVLGGCVNPNQRILDSDGAGQLQLRQMQTRYFDTSDKQKTLEAVIATLQDLGFIIDKASLPLGSVTGTKIGGTPIRMTVNVTS